MSKEKRLDKTAWYQNRELSWLVFNQRVLEEGLDPAVPLLERLKFFAIVGSNLDEFFMIRVAGLRHQRAADIRKRDRCGQTPAQQLIAIADTVRAMMRQQSQGIQEVLERLKSRGLEMLFPSQWSPAQSRSAANYFNHEMLPLLTPLAIQQLEPAPLLPSLHLHLAFLVQTAAGKPRPAIVVVPIPGRLPRFLSFPAEGHEPLRLCPVEAILTTFAERLFPHQEILASAVFRITRDADIAIQDDDAADLLHSIEKAVLDRRRRAAVRLEISAASDERLRTWLISWLELRPEEVYECDGLLDAAALMQIVNLPGYDKLRDPEWPPQPCRDLSSSDDLFAQIAKHDALLFHPYEKFDPVIQLLEQAADDPDVIAVKQTLYRTGGDSPIIKALERAARSGKQVTVLMELKARFDEARNIESARRLEDAGCLVIYGIVGYKTHSKALLIIRREQTRICRYVHLSTGNYNHKTATLYSDLGLMTAHPQITADVAEFFHLLTGISDLVEMSALTIAPTDLRRRFLDLIDREIRFASLQQPASIRAKLNSLEDPEIIQALYRASAAGVSIKLHVRGICCLRPGLKQVSENIEVRSLVDRFLEHPRIYSFHNAGSPEIFLSSADWMTRNLDKRLELLFPILDAEIKRRIVGILDIYFQDNTKARVLGPDGKYRPVSPAAPPVRAQEQFFLQALSAGQSQKRGDIRFKPMSRP